MISSIRVVNYWQRGVVRVRSSFFFINESVHVISPLAMVQVREIFTTDD